MKLKEEGIEKTGRKSRIYVDPEWLAFYSPFKRFHIDIDQAIILSCLAIHNTDNQIKSPVYETHIQKTLFIGYVGNSIPIISNYIPYREGPYSHDLKLRSIDLVRKGMIRRREVTNSESNDIQFLYSITDNVRRTTLKILNDDNISEEVFNKLVNTSQNLNLRVPEIKKKSTDLMERYFDTPRPILYTSQEFNRATAEEAESKTKIGLTIGPINIEEIPVKVVKPSDELVINTFKKLRREMPYNKLVRERTGDKFSWKFVIRTKMGISLFYSMIYEVYKVWANANQLERNELLKSRIQSIGYIVNNIKPKEVVIGKRRLIEFSFTDGFIDSRYPSTMSMLIDEKDLRCTIQAFMQRRFEVSWNLNTNVDTSQLHMYPSIIEAF